MSLENPERLVGIDLNLLTALDALLAERSVTDAARRLGVRQPAMSSTLTRLRRLFDDPLFVREGIRLVPTPTAESLVGPLAEALSVASAIRDGRRRFDPASDRRTMTVIASDYVTIMLLHPLLVELHETAPYLDIEARPISADFASQLRRGFADLVIVPRATAGSPDGLLSLDLLSDRNICAIDASRRDLGERLTTTQLESLALYTLEGGPLDTVNVRDLGRPPRNRGMDVSAQSFLASAFMIAGTRAAALLPSLLVEKLAQPARIRPVELPVDLPVFTEAMYWSERRHHDPAVQWLRKQFIDEAGRIATVDV